MVHLLPSLGADFALDKNKALEDLLGLLSHYVSVGGCFTLKLGCSHLSNPELFF